MTSTWTCTARAYQHALDDSPARALLSRHPQLYLSGRDGSSTRLLLHPVACHFGDRGGCGAAVGTVRRISTQTRLPALALNGSVTLTLCPAAPAVSRLEFAAIRAVAAGNAVDSATVQRELRWALVAGAELGVLPQAQPGLWEQVAACAGPRFLTLAERVADPDAAQMVAYVKEKMRELSARLVADVGPSGHLTSADGRRWWVALTAGAATRIQELNQMSPSRAALLVHAPLVGVLNERPGRLLAWQVPEPGGSVDVDTFGGWPVMPVTADADSDLAVLRVVAASGVEGAAAAQVAQAALAAQV